MKKKNKKRKELPDLRGYRLEDAQDELKKLGIKYDEDTNKELSLFMLPNRVKSVAYDKNDIVEITVSRFPLIFLILIGLIIGLIIPRTIIYMNERTPKIESRYANWEVMNTVFVKEDAVMGDKLKEYEYCISKDGKVRDCEWKRTNTKNIDISEDGVWFVYFRGVSLKERRSGISNQQIVYIDNTSPEVDNIVNTIEGNKIRIKIEAHDNLSGIKGYYYILDYGQEVPVESEFEIDNLRPGKEYKIIIVVTDNAGNEKEIEYKFSIEDGIIKEEKEEEQEENKEERSNTEEKENTEGSCKINCDIDDDGKCDLNCDTDGDGKCDLNCDTDGDGKCDLNCDEDGDGKCDRKCDEDGDGSCDINCEYLPSGGGVDPRVPRVSLGGVPSKFKDGEVYELPTSYYFDEEGGEVICTVDGEGNYKDTKELVPGKYTIECTANGNNGLSAKDRKEIEVLYVDKDEEEWDGWIRMNLYYPEGSTEWEWRLGNENEVRTGENSTSWQPYTGPITVRYTDVENVYIRYKMNGILTTVPPKGKLLVDIEPESYELLPEEKTRVVINYEKDAEVKQYTTDGVTWLDYTGPFEVGPETLIAARVKKTINVLDEEGNVISTKQNTNIDNAYISLIDPKYISEDVKVTINVDDEVGEGHTTIATLTYSEEPDLIQYSINDGAWHNYTEPFEVGPKTAIRARISKEVDCYYKGEVVDRIEKEDYDYRYVELQEPISERLVLNINASREEVWPGQTSTITLTYSENPDSIKYSTNYGETWLDYTGSFEVGPGTKVYAYLTKTVDQILDDEVVGQITKTKVESREIGTRRSYSGGGSGGGGGGWYGGDNPEPYIRVPAPSINETLASNEKSATITISAPQAYSAMYYKIGEGNWQEYTKAFTINNNVDIYAYYVSNESDTVGINSKTAHVFINNIKKPYVNIYQANSDASYLSEDNIIIEAFDQVKLQYSFDNITWQEYTGPFEVTKNGRIYAKNITTTGDILLDYVDITNMGNPPKKPDNLYVGIFLNPEENEVEGLANKTIVTIDYDTKSTKNTYKLGTEGELKEYTGPFEVRNNTVVYAYATNGTGKGEAKKAISFLVNGIAEPAIYALPDIQSYSKTITIEYAKNAVTKQYKIGNGGWQNYTESFDVKENCVIYAKNSDMDGNVAQSSLVISNVMPEPQYELLEAGDYYILYPNYPATAKNKEYKWTPKGTWKKYDEKYGIMLIKQGHDSILQADGVIAQDRNGNELIYTDHYYILDGPISKMMENLFMRWDVREPDTPVVTLADYEPTREAYVIINYDKASVKKYYKIVYDDGTTSDWQEYNGGFKIDKNNTTIYFYSINSAEVSSKIGMYKITNIDENPPEINIKGNLTTASQKTVLTIAATDDVGVDYVSYAKGSKTLEDFKDIANILNNNSVVTIDENGIYTFYAVDKVGNGTVRKINVTNIDKTAPNITITDLTSGVNNTSIRVRIDYGDSTTKQYSFNGTTWTNYTDILTLNSLDVAKYKDDNGNLVVYAKGKDSAGNEITVSQEIYSIDLDVPATPIINADNIVYPTLTEYGVKLGGKAIIVYDTTRDDLKNEYSIDGGKTWKVYTGPFENNGVTIIARSTKKNSPDISVQSTKTISMATDAIPAVAYDGNENTRYYYDNMHNGASHYMGVDKSLWGKKILTISVGSPHVVFYDASGKVLQDTKLNNRDAKKIDEIPVPSGATKAYFTHTVGWGGYWEEYGFYEVRQCHDTHITTEYTYPTLTRNGVSVDFNIATISYFSTSVQQLYKIDNGNWQNYTGPVKVSIGQTIYSKGVDKYGKDTPIASYKSVQNSDAMPATIYDKRDDTCVQGTLTKILSVDKSLQGQKVNIVIYKLWGAFWEHNMYSINSDGTTTTVYSNSWPSSFIVPEKAVKLVFWWKDGSKLCEITPAATPKTASTNALLSPKLSLASVPRSNVSLTAPSTTTATTAVTDNNTIIESNTDVTQEEPTTPEEPTEPKEEKVNVSIPKYSITDEYDIKESKTLTITYDKNYINEYSYDAINWNKYEDGIEIKENGTIYARSVDANGKVLATSSYTITTIEEKEEVEEIDTPIEDSVTEDVDTSLPTEDAIEEPTLSNDTLEGNTQEEVEKPTIDGQTIEEPLPNDETSNTNPINEIQAKIIDNELLPEINKDVSKEVNDETITE